MIISASNYQFHNSFIINTMKKKDYLLQVLKKETTYHFTEYLPAIDLLNLSLTSKKYYTQLFPIVDLLRLDNDLAAKQNKSKPTGKKGKSKQTENQQIFQSIPETEVDIEKVSMQKFSKIFNTVGVGKWKRVEQLDFANDYLSKKIQNRTDIFFKNEQTGSLIYINRSFVDPNLNYNKGGFGQDFVNSGLYEHIYNEGYINQQDFSSQQALLKRQKENLQKIAVKKQERLKNETIYYQEQLTKAVNMKRFGIILCFGGSFSLGIYEKGQCIIHKSDKKYVCRKKAGERQFNKDKNAGSSIQSIGSQIRRDQQKKHLINVGQILKQHYKDLAECQIIFLQAPGLNRLFIINQNQNLDGLQNRLRSVCVTAKKANFTEVQSLYQTISLVHIVKPAEKKEQKKGKSKK